VNKGDAITTSSAHTPPSVAIAVAAHKPYRMPSDAMYVPVQAGALGRDTIPGFARDDECGAAGEGLSALNPHLSELTVAYWAWKTLCAAPDAPASPDVIGLVHYRRHFAGSGDFGTLTTVEARELLAQAPVILPRQRNYVIESVGSHYAHTFRQEHLDLLLATVGDLAPEYAPALRSRLAGTKAHMFNMFVMRRDLFDAYMTWLFPIIGQAEREFDYAGLSAFEARCPGRLSEFLLDTWLDTNAIPSIERPVKDMEPVNWAKKGSAFLAAKLFNKKYDQSF